MTTVMVKNRFGRKTTKMRKKSKTARQPFSLFFMILLAL